MCIIWLSANKFGLELLKEATKQKKVTFAGIITLSGKSKMRMYDGVSIKEWERFDMPLYQVNNINEEVELVRSLKPDMIIACGWRQIISHEILKIPKKGVIGFHPTLLPCGRGPAPIINTILSGWKKSGVTMFYLDEGLDNGDIIAQEKFSIRKSDNAKAIYSKVIKAGKRLTKKYLPLLGSEICPRFSQSENKATYFSKIRLADNEISLKDDLDLIDKKIRAFSKPYLGAFIKQGQKKLVIWKAQIKNDD